MCDVMCKCYESQSTVMLLSLGEELAVYIKHSSCKVNPHLHEINKRMQQRGKQIMSKSVHPFVSFYVHFINLVFYYSAEK